MVRIKKQLINNSNYHNGKNNPGKFITLHMTGNRVVGADAQAHANLQSNGNSRNASWHWQVDDKQAIQSFDHKYKLWHASDGQGSGNNESIGIEGCVNSDGDFNQMMKNYVDLVVHVMKECNIKDTNNIVTHYWWSGKNCPTQMFQGKNGWTFDYFISQVKKSMNKNTTTSAPVPEKKSGWITNKSGVQYLQTNGKWKNGDEEITVRFHAPDVNAKYGGKAKPGYIVNYTGICRFGGYIWLEYTLDKGKTWKYIPVKTWDSKTGKVGHDWGTWL